MPDNERPVSPMNGVPLPEGIPFTKDDERAANAGRKSGESRRARKTLREELLALLTEHRPDKQGRMTPIQTAMSTALINQALHGSVRAFEVIRDTIGEKPAENVTLTSGSFDALEEAFAALDKDADQE